MKKTQIIGIKEEIRLQYKKKERINHQLYSPIQEERTHQPPTLFSNTRRKNTSTTHFTLQYKKKEHINHQLYFPIQEEKTHQPPTLLNPRTSC
jgi:hypothetical protein